MTSWLAPHPHIVTPCAFVWNQEEKICSDLLLPFGGENLYAWRPTEPLKWPQPLLCFEQIVSAVAHLHLSDVLHHDLDASNVLLKDDDGKHTLSVIDLGVAEKLSRLNPELRYRGHGRSSAPEQDEDSKLPLTPAIDVFPLASIGYRLICTSSNNSSNPTERFTAATANIKDQLLDAAFIESVGSRHHPRPQSSGEILSCIWADCLGSPSWFWQLLENCQQEDPSNRPTPQQILETFQANRFRTY